MMTRRWMLFWGMLLLISCFLPCYSWGQEKFPTRPVTLVVGAGPGGAHDILTRLISVVAQDYLGQPLQVILKPGAGGIIGAQFVARAKPDGYTLNPGATTVNSIHCQMEDTGFTKDSFVAIAKITHTPIILCVPANKPWKTLEDLLDYIRKNPGKARYGTNAPKGIGPLAQRRLMSSAGIKSPPNMVVFKSVSDLVMSMLKGDIEFGIQPDIAFLPFIESKELRALATLERKGRLPALPDVPSLKECGHDIVAQMWIAILAPKGTPEAIVEKLETVFENIVKDPRFIERAKKIDMPIYYEGRREFQKIWDEEYKMYGELIDQLGLRKKK